MFKMPYLVKCHTLCYTPSGKCLKCHTLCYSICQQFSIYVILSSATTPNVNFMLFYLKPYHVPKCASLKYWHQAFWQAIIITFVEKNKGFLKFHFPRKIGSKIEFRDVLIGNFTQKINFVDPCLAAPFSKYWVCSSKINTKTHHGLAFGKRCNRPRQIKKFAESNRGPWEKYPPSIYWPQY